jgi:hypothetical protein
VKRRADDYWVGMEEYDGWSRGCSKSLSWLTSSFDAQYFGDSIGWNQTKGHCTTPAYPSMVVRMDNRSIWLCCGWLLSFSTTGCFIYMSFSSGLLITARDFIYVLQQWAANNRGRLCLHQQEIYSLSSQFWFMDDPADQQMANSPVPAV